MQINWVILILFILGCNLLGALGSLWAGGDSDWYKQITKPNFNPPSWIFGPVWSLIFSLMGVALYFVFFSGDSNIRTIALILFGVQFILNILWSYLFFGLQSPMFAFIEIIVLLALIVLTGIYFFKIKPLSGVLMIPYVLWVGFASILNFSIWKLNLG